MTEKLKSKYYLYILVIAYAGPMCYIEEDKTEQNKGGNLWGKH